MARSTAPAGGAPRQQQQLLNSSSRHFISIDKDTTDNLNLLSQLYSCWYSQGFSALCALFAAIRKGFKELFELLLLYGYSLI